MFENAATREYEKWSKKQLIKRLLELEQQATLPAGESVKCAEVNGATDSKPGVETVPVPKKRKFDFSKHSTRFVAFRFAYLGWNYNGLNFQYDPTPLPTVEEDILQAMYKAKMVAEPDPATCNFSRCGRTDKGVSALNQVISLDVRSSLSSEEQSNPNNDTKELPYLTILNALLPPDIRITAVCLRPPEGFNARFSCTYRHYKYLFKKENLNIELMQQAAKKYEGVHDFRNFCKIDGSKQITNHSREIYSANIVHHHDDFYVFDLKGSAFLWHQVRCMVAVLFSVGQELESPLVIDNLVDVEKLPSKPLFEMANDIPLVLYDCVFPDMEWLNSAEHFNGSQKAKLSKEYARFNGQLLDMEIKAHITNMVKDVYVKDVKFDSHLPGAGRINTGDGIGRNFKTYVPICERVLGETVEKVNERHREKQIRKGKRNADGL